jgi:hypothetical protein
LKGRVLTPVERRLVVDLMNRKPRAKKRPAEERVKFRRGLLVVAAHLLETLATGRRDKDAWSNEKLFSETVKHFTDGTGLSRTAMLKIFSELKARRLSPEQVEEFRKLLATAEPDGDGEGFTINDTLI